MEEKPHMQEVNYNSCAYSAMTFFKLFAESDRNDCSSSFKWSGKEDMTPSLPKTAGRLRQQPHSFCQWLSGKTWRWSNMMASQILAVTAATPYDVNPFTLMMVSAFILVVVAISSRSASVKGRASNSGVPCTVAVDQATY